MRLSWPADYFTGRSVDSLTFFDCCHVGEDCRACLWDRFPLGLRGSGRGRRTSRSRWSRSCDLPRTILNLAGIPPLPRYRQSFPGHHWSPYRGDRSWMGSYQVLVCQSRGLATIHGVGAGLAFAALCLEMHAGSTSGLASCARVRNIQAGKGTLLKVMDCERKHCWYRPCLCA